MTDFQFISILILITQMGVAGWQVYIGQKAKNKADKEDIQDLTRLVEHVKGEFNTKMAKTNTDLDILKDRKGKSYTQAQQALIDFYYNYNMWLQHLLGIIPEYFSIKNFAEIENYIVENAANLKKTHVSFSTLSLLVTDDETVKLANECLLKGMAFDGSVTNTLGPLERNLYEASKLVDQILTLKDQGEDRYSFDKWLNERYEERERLIDDFNKKKRVCYLDAHGAAQKFENCARSFLND